jgi:hypothetical protein
LISKNQIRRRRTDGMNLRMGKMTIDNRNYASLGEVTTITPDNN